MRGATTSRERRSASTSFQSTLLMRGATGRAHRARKARDNFNPRSSCEERPEPWYLRQSAQDFNPRSSCEERRYGTGSKANPGQISIHAPHARSDLLIHILLVKGFLQFQSTLLMRGATPLIRRDNQVRGNFNPRSSCEERLNRGHIINGILKFQSTLLMRGATR